MGYYKSDFQKLFREIFLSPQNSLDRMVRAGVLGLPFLTYPIIVLYENSDGTRLVSPHNVLEYASVLLISVAVALSGISLGFFVAMTAVHGRKLRWVHFILGMLGFRASAAELKRVRQNTEMLKKHPLSVNTIESSVVLAGMLNRALQAVVPDFRYTAAWWRSRKLLRVAPEIVAAHMDYLETDDAFHSALQHAVEKHYEIFGETDKSLDQTLVYVSVSRDVPDINTLVLMNKYLVAGKSPLQRESSYGRYAYDATPRLAGMNSGYSALLCIPRWMCDSLLTLKQFDGEPASATGTYKDTVAFLWNRNRSNLYHQPTKLVAAAKRLDKNRRGEVEHYVD